MAPKSQKQMATLLSAQKSDDIAVILQEFVKERDEGYYYHIDQMQIIWHEYGSMCSIVLVYHREHLKEG